MLSANDEKINEVMFMCKIWKSKALFCANCKVQDSGLSYSIFILGSIFVATLVLGTSTSMFTIILLFLFFVFVGDEMMTPKVFGIL